MAIKVEFVIDYSVQSYGAAEEIIAEDRAILCEYGAIVKEDRKGEGGAIYVYHVEFETEDGWEAYEQAHETCARLTLDTSELRRL